MTASLRRYTGLGLVCALTLLVVGCGEAGEQTVQADRGASTDPAQVGDESEASVISPISDAVTFDVFGTLVPGDVTATVSASEAISFSQDWLLDGNYEVSTISGLFTSESATMDPETGSIGAPLMERKPVILVIQWNAPEGGGSDLPVDRIAVLDASGDFHSGFQAPAGTIVDSRGVQLGAADIGG